MVQHEQTEKQPKKRSRAGIVVLVLLLIIAGAAGYLYYSIVKAPLDLDDPKEMAASVSMMPEERFSFSAAEKTVQVKMDAADIWSLILEKTGKNILDAINREVNPYALTVSGCTIHMDEEGLRLDLELYYKETRLVAKVPCALEVTETGLSLTPIAVKLGVIPLPVENILSNLKLELDLQLPVLSQVTQIEFVSGAVLLSGPVEPDIRGLVPVNQDLYLTAVFSQEHQAIVDALQTDAGFEALLSHLEKDPGSVEDLYRELFLLTEPDTRNAYLDSRLGLTERFLPGIDFSAVSQQQEEETEQINYGRALLEQFFTSLMGDYNDKKFKLDQGQFLLKNKPFQMVGYNSGKYDVLFEKLDPESFFLILVDAEDGFIRSTSSFDRMAKEGLEFTQSVDYNKTYILGCVLRSVDGDPFLVYDVEIDNGNTYSRSTQLHPLTEEEVSALQVPGKFGVWTG